MKNKYTFLVLVLFLFQFCLGQSNTAKEILGQIVEQSTSVVGVNIINNTTQVATVSDENGRFLIVAKQGDVLVFSAVNLEALRYRITAEDMELKSIRIKMIAKEVELKEVIVNENSGINAENMGIIPYGQKKYTAAERKVYAATTGPVDILLNKISGRTQMLKKEVDVERREVLFRKMEYLFSEDYYTERLKIPLEDIKGFQLYCVENTEFAVSLNTKNKTMSMFLITDLARKYLIILQNEK